MTARLIVREMRLAEVGFRIDYFHEASDEHLRTLGVDRALLPTRDAWRAFYEEDFARPVRDRTNYLLVWEREGSMVGFSSADRIVVGKEAFMHLHILNLRVNPETGSVGRVPPARAGSIVWPPRSGYSCRVLRSCPCAG